MPQLTAKATTYSIIVPRPCPHGCVGPATITRVIQVHLVCTIVLSFLDSCSSNEGKDRVFEAPSVKKRGGNFEAM